MTDLTTWLLEQIEADEAVARAATEGPWEAATGASGSESWVERRNLADIAYVQGNPNHAADAEHIARAQIFIRRHFKQHRLELVIIELTPFG